MVLTLWAAVVAERLGFGPETELTLGRFIAGSSARAKARRLGIVEEKLEAEERAARAAELKPRREMVHLLGRDIPVLKADDGTPQAEDDGNPRLFGAHNHHAKARIALDPPWTPGHRGVG